MGVYSGSKPDFSNNGLFAIDARVVSRRAALVGVPARLDAGWEARQVVPLASKSLTGAGGVRGWMKQADVGFQPVGDGLFYVANNIVSFKLQAARLTLMRWTGLPHQPFLPAR